VLEIQTPARPSERFLVRLRVREDLHALVRTDSVATIQTDGIVRNAFVQIGMGTDEARVIGPDDLLVGVDPIECADLIKEGRDTFRLVSREFMESTGEVTRTVDETVGDVRGLLAGVKEGEGTVGKLFTDTTVYDRIAGATRDAEQTARTVRETAEPTRDAVLAFSGPGGMGPQLTQSIRNTLAGIEGVTFDLAEGAEALKRNVLFRGFFRERGYFDLDSISREAYQQGLLERNHTAVRIWIDGAVIFARAADGREVLTDDGRRRLDAAMAQLMQYPRNSPLVVEGYAADDEDAYLVSLDRAQRVLDYVLSRFRRQTASTAVMPLSGDAAGSPSGDGAWAGVALTMYVPNATFREGAR
jgi:phospholipid/cholesterol/gamma-HCH transport system substrate-binding protein